MSHLRPAQPIPPGPVGFVHFEWPGLDETFFTPLCSKLGMTTERAYEAQRNVLTSISGQWGATTIARYDYTTNALGQRTSVKQSGTAFGDYGASTYQQFGYNPRSELTSALGYLGEDVTQTAQPLPSRQFTFNYDNIGNRVSTTRATDVPAEAYTTNALNQIVTKENRTVSVSGTVDAAAKVAVAGSGGAAKRQGRYWADELAVNNATVPWRGALTAYAGKTGTSPDLLRIDARLAFIAAQSQAFSYDNDGNLLSDGLWDYTWDAENRLIALETAALAYNAGFPKQRLEFKYDWMGRRIEKLVREGWNGSNYMSIASQRRYVYDDWNIIAEYGVNSSSLLIYRSYTWGLDIAHSLTKAGGVGALLQVSDHDTGKTYFSTYDGNGNVTTLVNANGGIAAVYEYTTFGEPKRVNIIDSVVRDQAFGFATKYTDAEIDLVYYNNRFYNYKLGRFISRDPFEEKGGMNVYAYCLNSPVATSDVGGMYPFIYGQDGDWWQWPVMFSIMMMTGDITGDDSTILSAFYANATPISPDVIIGQALMGANNTGLNIMNGGGPSNKDGAEKKESAEDREKRKKECEAMLASYKQVMEKYASYTKLVGRYNDLKSVFSKDPGYGVATVKTIEPAFDAIASFVPAFQWAGYMRQIAQGLEIVGFAKDLSWGMPKNLIDFAQNEVPGPYAVGDSGVAAVNATMFTLKTLTDVTITKIAERTGLLGAASVFVIKLGENYVPVFLSRVDQDKILDSMIPNYSETGVIETKQTYMKNLEGYNDAMRRSNCSNFFSQ